MGRGTRVLWRIALALTAIATYAVAVTVGWGVLTSRHTALRPEPAFSRLTAAIEMAVVDDQTGLVARSVCRFTPAVQSYALSRKKILSVSRCLEKRGYLSASDVAEIEADAFLASFQMECTAARHEGDKRLAAGCFTSSATVIAGRTAGRSQIYNVAWLAGLALVAWLVGVRLPLKVAGIATVAAVLGTVVLLVSLSLIG